MTVLKRITEIEMLCLNSKENFDDNKQYLKRGMEMKQNPVIGKLLQQDSVNINRMQVQMATSREFLIKKIKSNVFLYLSRIEKSLKDQGFAARRADNKDIKRLLGVYYERNVITEKREDYDRER